MSRRQVKETTADAYRLAAGVLKMNLDNGLIGGFLSLDLSCSSRTEQEKKEIEAAYRRIIESLERTGR